jgi:hypothetical protein
MKKMFKLFMCAAVVAAGFTACSEEVTPIGPEYGPDDTETGLLTVNFRDANPMTRASGDKDISAIDAERKVRDVTILIFNDQGVCKVDTTLYTGEFNPDPNTDLNKVNAVNINVPLGPHHVYAGINLTSGAAHRMKETLGGKGTINGVSKYVYFGVDENTPKVDSISFLYKANEFPMFASEFQPVNILPIGNANSVTISVDRMVAKVTIQKGTAFSGDNLKASGATFDGATVKWSLGHLNGKVYPYGKANFGQDPNYDYIPSGSDPNDLKTPGGVAYRNANFANDFNTTDASYSNWDLNPFLAIDGNNTAVASRTSKYAPENNSAKMRLGESTFAAIMVKFAPDKIYTYTDGDSAPKEVPLGTGPGEYTPNIGGVETFYVVTSGAVYYFRAKADADAYALSLNGPNNQNPFYKVKVYQGQYCFYHLMLGDKDKSEKGITKRNHYYLLTVNRFVGLGTPAAEIPEEDVNNTADDQGILDVNITINEWQIEEQDEELKN